MTLPIVFFSLSGFAMIYLVLHKRMEHSYGKGLILRNVVHKCDGMAHACYSKSKRFASYINKKNLVIILNHIVVVFLKATIFISTAIKKEMSVILEKLTRKQEVLTKKGAASAYLKQISENKHNGNGAPKNSAE